MLLRPITLNTVAVRSILSGRQTQLRLPVKPQPKVDKYGPRAVGQKYAIGAWSWDPPAPNTPLWWTTDPAQPGHLDYEKVVALSPYGVVGDQLWVKERWYCDHTDVMGHYEMGHSARLPLIEWQQELYYAADGKSETQFAEANTGDWRGWWEAKCMPRWAARIGLEIKSARMGRLLDLSWSDFDALGICHEVIDLTTDRGGLFSSRALRVAFEQALAADRVSAFKLLWKWTHSAPSADPNMNPWVWIYGVERVDLPRSFES